MKKKIIMIFSIVMLLVLNTTVYAETYDISFTTKHSNKIKPGDIIEVKAGISAVVEDEVIIYQSFSVFYDTDVFDLVWSDNEDSTYHYLRKDWQMEEGGGGLGSVYGTFYANDFDSGATIYNASDNSLDDMNFDIVSFKLQVKDVKNQYTSVSLVNGDNYQSELKFEVYTPSSGNNLKEINFNRDDIILSPVFDKNKTSYEVNVPYNVSKLKVTGVLEDDKAKIKGNGEYNLNEGNNTILLEVTSETGKIKKYTIDIYRAPANMDTSLAKVEVRDSNKKIVELTYDETKKEYRGKVSHDITFVTYDIRCSGDECRVSDLTTEALNTGENKYKFKVMSQKGEEQVYTIIIDKESPKKNYTNIIVVVLLVISILGNIILGMLLVKNKLSNKKQEEQGEVK